MKTTFKTPPRVAKRNGLLMLGSMAVTFVVLRLVLHWSPNTDLNLGRYNIHHLFTGLLLIALGGIPLAVFRGSTRRLDLALVIFGAGLGMALDEWVYLIATDGSNASYLLPVSFWGGLAAVGLACAYTVGLVIYGLLRDRAAPRHQTLLCCFALVWSAAYVSATGFGQAKEARVGIIGLDTSHSIEFAKVLNDPNAAPDVAGYRVVAAYPQGSPDIVSSASRIPGYTEQVKKMGIEVVSSIEELLPKVDVVLLETNDGRPHLAQAKAVFKAGKPVFIDKPLAGSLADAVAIRNAARQSRVPVFSSSSLRFMKSAQAIRGGSIGAVLGAEAYSPATLEKTHPDLFWYGIHGIEALFTVMGTGCERVVRVHAEGTDVVVGTWRDGRLGTFRGLRHGQRGYGGTAFGAKGIAPVGPYEEGYRPLLVEIVRFFRTGVAPVSLEETLEIYAFMEAADESQRQGGRPVTIESVMSKAEQEAQNK